MHIIRSFTAVVLSVFLILFSFPLYANALVSAKSMVLINASTKEILMEQNAHEKLPMASTTKMMTALILAETNNLEKQITTTEKMVTVEGSSMGLLAGDTVSYYALLVGMMLSSGNDAANTTAICLAGSVEEFAKMMNERAKQIGMVNTNFVTPSGLDSDGHYSTAYDMALLAAEVISNDVLREIVSSEKLTVSFGNPPYNRTLYNHNKLLSRYESCIGIKTGYTKKAGRCLVSAAEKDGCEVIAVTLNASDDWNIHETLLKEGLSILQPTKLLADISNVYVPIVGAKTQRVGITADGITVGTLDGFLDVDYCFNLPKFLYAPIKRGQKIGTVQYLIDGKIIGVGNVYSDIDVNLFKKDYSFKEKLFHNIYSMLCLFS